MNERKVIKISLGKFLAIMISVAAVIFLATNWYLHSLEMTNIFNLSAEQEKVRGSEEREEKELVTENELESNKILELNLENEVIFSIYPDEELFGNFGMAFSSMIETDFAVYRLVPYNLITNPNRRSVRVAFRQS